MNRPFSLLSIPLVFGIIITYYLDFSIIISLSLFCTILFMCIINLIREKSSSLLFIFLFISLGALITSSYLNSSRLLGYIGDQIKIEAIVDETIWRDGVVDKYVLKVENIYFGNEIKEVNEKTILKINGKTNLKLGDKITFRGKLKEPLKNTNPKLYNYKLNLLSNKIYTTVNINDNDIMSVNGNGKGLKYKLRIGFKDMVEELFNSNLDNSSSNLMKGIIMGESSYLDENNISKYREMGLAHILAVSGLHIGIISGFLIFLFSHLGIKKKINIFIVLGIIWFYGFLIGFPPSVLRASIMFSFLFYAKTLAEPYDSINILFISFFILLIANPISIFNLGFQLSYTATFSILYFSPYINKRFYPYNNKLTYTLSGLLGIYIGILPVQLYYFNSFSIMGIFFNLIIAPILSFALILGGIMIILNYIVPIFNIFLGSILNFVLLIQEYLIDFLYIKGIGTIEFRSPSIFEFILYYIIVFIILRIIDFKKIQFSIKKVIFSYGMIFIVFNLLFIVFDNSMEIGFIDVGQGDAILLKTNKSSYLIDTGGNEFSDFDIGENIVLPYLKKHGVSELEAVFITHFHLDHCKSLPLLMENIDIKNIFISYENPDNEIYQVIKEASIPVTILNEEDMIYLESDIAIEVVSPGIDFHKRGFSENDMSLTFNLSYYNMNILFTGDIESKTEEILSRKLKNEIYLLKVPHHGSKTSSTEEFLNILRPKVAVIPVGKNNFYGHPDAEVLHRYQAMETKVYRTDNMGMIKVKLNKNKVEITPFLREVEFLELVDEYVFNWIFIILFYLISYIIIRIYSIKERELGKYELQ